MSRKMLNVIRRSLIKATDVMSVLMIIFGVSLIDSTDHMTSILWLFILPIIWIMLRIEAER